MAIAVALRVLPAYSVVFAHGFVNFQEPDAWFHVRTVRNLLAHFPYRSGFDPYALFPGGQNIPTAPVWDYLLASVAWLLGGARHPPHWPAGWRRGSPRFWARSAPIPAFFLARRFFGGMAGAFAALWVAVASGDLLWITHLGPGGPPRGRGPARIPHAGVAVRRGR